jgi:hypothetical protein
VLLAALLSVAISFVWHTDTLPRQAVGIVLTADLLLMVIIVERMTHTTYTVTSSRTLVIHKGRLIRDRVISLDEIDRIDRISSLKVGGRVLRSSLVIVTKDNHEHHVSPRNEEDFIQCIIKRKQAH